MKTVIFSYDGSLKMTQVVSGKVLHFIQKIERRNGVIVGIK